MLILSFALLALVSFATTSDMAMENRRLRKANSALLKALRSLTVRSELAVGDSDSSESSDDVESDEKGVAVRYSDRLDDAQREADYYCREKTSCETCQSASYECGWSTQRNMCFGMAYLQDAIPEDSSSWEAIIDGTMTCNSGMPVWPWSSKERAVGNAQCSHITEDNKSYMCNGYYKKIVKCGLCLDDDAGAVDNSAINDAIRGRKRERAVGNEQCAHINDDNKDYSCSGYYKNIVKCAICQDDYAGAVDNSAINEEVEGCVPCVCNKYDSATKHYTECGPEDDDTFWRFGPMYINCYDPAKREGNYEFKLFGSCPSKARETALSGDCEYDCRAAGHGDNCRSWCNIG